MAFGYSMLIISVYERTIFLLYDSLSIPCNQPRVGSIVAILEVIQGQTNPNFII